MEYSSNIYQALPARRQGLRVEALDAVGCTQGRAIVPLVVIPRRGSS